MTGGIRYASLLLLVGAACITTADLIRGQRIAAVRAVIVSPLQVGRDQLVASWDDHPAQLVGTSPPEALGLAALWIDQAASSREPFRQRALANADAMLARARASRPEAPGASLLQVHADLVRLGKPRPSTLAAFARSYRQASFLREEGLWRLAFAATYWSELSKATRTAVINEAIWLARIDGQLRNTVDQLVTGTPLALPVELRLIS